MQLTLNVLRCPPTVTQETQTLSGGDFTFGREFTVGRGPSVDWVLPDVGQMVSRLHCTLAFRSGVWHVTDKSANGTFSNHDEKPIGKDKSLIVRDQDRLRIGPYEIELLLVEEGAGPNPVEPSFYADPPVRGYYDDDTAKHPVWTQPSPGFSETQPFTQQDDSSALGHALRPPGTTGPIFGRPSPADLPEGWERDLWEGLPGAQSSPPPPPTAVPRSEPDRPPEHAVSNYDGALLAAFLAGAGLPDAKLADPATTMRQLGETFRNMVSGLRAVLIARAAIKGEFRIEQTMMQARDNNPLKFSADDKDAIAALLGLGRHVGMTPARAVHDALRDIRLHELASIAAMQSAIQALLEGLDPIRLQSSREQAAGGFFSANAKKARAWDAYKELHLRVTQALSDDFDSVFGKAFARAYEEAFNELDAQDRS